MKTLRRISFRSLGVLPYLIFMAIFLLWPVAVNIWQGFHNIDGQFSTESMTKIFTGQYLAAFKNSLVLSTVTAVLGGIFGIILAWAVVNLERPQWLKSVVLSFLSLASQLGGVTLAFAFVAAIGTQGIVTQWVTTLTGWNLAEAFPLSSSSGLTIVYLYFQVPLMTILMLPAMSGMKREWSEAAASLGATKFRYLIDVALPILAPAIVGSLMLLFANAFAAYATAYALAQGINLVPILVGFFISGDTVSDPSLGASLVTGMMLILLVIVVARSLLLQRSSRWLR